MRFLRSNLLRSRAKHFEFVNPSDLYFNNLVHVYPYIPVGEALSEIGAAIRSISTISLSNEVMNSNSPVFIVSF